MTGSFETGEFLAGFVAEASEHLEASSANLLALEEAKRRGEPRPRAVLSLFRSVHTIKGLAAMVGVEAIVDVAHAMETLLRGADSGGGHLSPEAIDLLLRGLRAIEERVGEVASQGTVRPAPASLLDALEAARTSEREARASSEVSLTLEPELLGKLSGAEAEELVRGARSGLRAVRIEFVPSPDRAASGVSITTVRERVSALAEIVKIVPRSLPESQAAPGGLAFVILAVTGASDAALAEAASTDLERVRALEIETKISFDDASGEEAAALGEATQRRGVVRVEVSRLDDALDKLSALVVSRFKLQRAVAELAARGVDVRELRDLVSENGRQLRDLRGSITRARMVSLAELLERVPLLVRGLGRTLGKSVRLELDAGQAELDKAVAERAFPAIVHLIRNAVDHGLESPAERQRIGKPEEGVIRVRGVERSANRLEVVIEDDGAGIDREAVARRAGRPVPETDAALLELITLPGLSTAAATTHTSGRGLGMDIVERIVVTELGGELGLHTVRGQGTTFTLRIPLTITIVDALSFRCADRQFVVPLATVEEIVDVEGDRPFSSPRPVKSGAEVRLFERRGEAVPLVSLADLFELGRAPVARPKAMIVRRNGEAFAFEVDRMVGQQEVVVRPLEDPLVRVVGVSGTTDLGDGNPTLVLDLVALSSSIAEHARGVRS